MSAIIIDYFHFRHITPLFPFSLSIQMMLIITIRHFILAAGFWRCHFAALIDDTELLIIAITPHTLILRLYADYFAPLLLRLRFSHYYYADSWCHYYARLISLIFHYWLMLSRWCARQLWRQARRCFAAADYFDTLMLIISFAIIISPLLPSFRWYADIFISPYSYFAMLPLRYFHFADAITPFSPAGYACFHYFRYAITPLAIFAIIDTLSLRERAGCANSRCAATLPPLPHAATLRLIAYFIDCRRCRFFIFFFHFRLRHYFHYFPIFSPRLRWFSPWLLLRISLFIDAISHRHYAIIFDYAGISRWLFSPLRHFLRHLPWLFSLFSPDDYFHIVIDTDYYYWRHAEFSLCFRGRCHY